MDLPGNGSEKRVYMDRIPVRAGRRLTLVRAEEIDWIEAAANYVRIHAGGEAHVLREKISAIEAELDPLTFVRIHRSRIVNVEKIRGLETISRGARVIVLQDGTRLRLSRGQRGKLPVLTRTG